MNRREFLKYIPFIGALVTTIPNPPKADTWDDDEFLADAIKSGLTVTKGLDNTLCVSSQQIGRMYLCGNGGAILVSDDYGLTWAEVTSGTLSKT